ncbi:MAG: family 3 adenylate cyclase [Planctomycetaceae bacterium]|nr:family 3 adenylate cyclase [Planctomycetaceae bacterium]
MGQLYVVISHDSVFTRMHEVEGPKTVIGRNDDCAIRLPDVLVSREHAILLKTETGFRIRDLGSRNGTCLNGRRIHGEEVLDEGAEVQIRPFRLKVCFSIAEAVKQTVSSEDSTRSASLPAEDSLIEPANVPRLTPGQLRVYNLFVQGFIEKEVAKQLGISVNTVHDHAKAIYKTLSVSTRGELVSDWATRHALRNPEKS